MHPRRLVLLVALWLGAAALSADPLVSLAVVPFVNLSDYQGHLLQRRAAAAVAAEAAAPWAAVDPAAVQRALDAMAAPWPLGTSDLQALCNRLPAAMALSGAISLATVDKNTAHVVLHLELIEPLSGELVGKAQGEGRAQSREPLCRDALLEQALALAAQAALRQLGRAPYGVGQVAEGTTAGFATITLAHGVKLQVKSVLLLTAAQGVAPPGAVAVVEELTETTARVKILGQRQEGLAGGETAVLVGRLP